MSFKYFYLLSRVEPSAYKSLELCIEKKTRFYIFILYKNSVLHDFVSMNVCKCDKNFYLLENPKQHFTVCWWWKSSRELSHKSLCRLVRKHQSFTFSFFLVSLTTAHLWLEATSKKEIPNG